MGTATHARLRAVREPIAGAAFAARHIAIELRREPDGTARLATLGMSRFGAPDLVLRGAPLNSGPLLVDVLEEAAGAIAAGRTALPIRVGSNVPGSDGGASAALAAFAASPLALTPDGEADDRVELVPSGASQEATREEWDALASKLAGSAPAPDPPPSSTDFPAALSRLERDGGELFVLSPFAIADDDREAGGPGVAWLWMKVATCDATACTGALSSRPRFASNVAAGRTSRVLRAKIVDYLLYATTGAVVGGGARGIAR